MKRSHRVYDIVKRVADFVLAGLLLVALSPLLVVIALFVRVALGAPVLFRQTRPGLRGEPFTMVKFRTMREADPSAGQIESVATDAQRITPAGRFLRATSLDELPELWNVVRGEMSLVGPRPLLVEYLPRYNSEQARRHDVRPGLTGWAQVNGRNELDWNRRLAMDVWYVDHRSLLLDLRIVARTFSTVLGRAGVSATGHETVRPFDPEQSVNPDEEDS